MLITISGERLCFTLNISVATTIHKNNGTNDKFYRKVAILMYTEMFNSMTGY